MQTESTTEGWMGRLSPKRKDSAVAQIATIVRDAVACKHDFVVFESSIDYVRCALVSSSKPSWSTIQTIHGELMTRLGASSLTPAQARGFGFLVRNVAKGKQRGGIYALTSAMYEKVVELSKQFTCEVRTRGLAADFLPLKVKFTNGRKMHAHCPYHDDRKPSASFQVVDNGHAARGVCHRCEGEDGRGLRLFAVSYNGEWFARRARVSSSFDGALNNVASKSTRISGTITRDSAASRLPTSSPRIVRDYSIEPHHLSKMSRICGKLRGTSARDQDFGMEQSRTDQTRLLDILVYHDRMAEKGRDEAWCRHVEWQISGGDYRQYVPDRFVAADLMRPTEWIEKTVQGRDVAVPRKFRPSAVTHVLIDLDGFTSAPVGNGSLEERTGVFVALSKAMGWHGEVATIRTSHGGLHIVFGLDTAKQTAWYADRDVQLKLRDLGARCLEIATAAGFAGGKHDTATLAPGKHVRRPGARIDKGGKLYVARLVFAVRGEEAIEPRKRKRVRKSVVLSND